MGAIANGMAYHGGVRTFTSFFCFSDYERPAIRLAALNHLPVVFVFTHDSIGLGEDGPTHQPVEHLAALRAIPNLSVLRPATPTRLPRPGSSPWSARTDVLVSAGKSCQPWIAPSWRLRRA